MMDRRRFLLTSLAGALAAPLAVGAQPTGKVYRIGIVINSGPAAGAAGAEPAEQVVAELLRGLRELGYVYGRDFVTEARSAEGRPDRIPTIAAELATLKVDVIVAGGPALGGLKQARISTPVVMSGAADPVQAGLVDSLARPGRNFTGFNLQHAELDRKRLELLTEVVPTAARVGVLHHSSDKRGWNETLAAAQLLKRELLSLEVRSADEVEGAFRTAKERRAGALVVIGGGTP